VKTPILSIALFVLVSTSACSSSNHAGGGALAGGTGGGPENGGADGSAGAGNGKGGASASGGGSSSPDGGVGSPNDGGSLYFDAPFERPDAGKTYQPQAGTCGLDAPAFCDTFESGPSVGGREGELDPSKWSVTRGGPWQHASLNEAFTIGPTLLPACRDGLAARALPDSEVLICDPTSGVPSRHLLTATAAQNYGLSTYRIRQPFDFSGRTGTIKFDVSLENNGLGGWPAISIAQDPSPAPSFDWEERGSGPRNGLEIEFDGGWCNNKHTVEVGLFTFADYVQTQARASFDCNTPHATTSSDALNHVEVYLTANHLEVWASDASPDGVTFPNFHQMYAADLNLPFQRGSVNLNVRNHATMKYWVGSAWTVRWDNVGFDGPVVDETREYGVPDSLTPVDGLDGCQISGTCQWRGDVIAQNPGNDKVCDPSVSCKTTDHGVNVGYTVPRYDEAPAALHVPGVDLTNATAARLVFAATYPWFDWNGV